MYEIRQLLFTGVLKELVLRTDSIDEVLVFINDEIRNDISKINEENFFDYYEIRHVPSGLMNATLINEVLA